MEFAKKIMVVLAVLVLGGEGMLPGKVGGLTVKQEEELSREVLQVIFQRYEIIDDPVVVPYVSQVGHRILAHLPEQPFEYHFYVIKEHDFNAFATPAGHIFVNSGLFAAMENEEELAGILAHEIAHVYCRHISQKIERSKKIGIATLAGIAAGILLGAGGAGDAAQAVTMGSMAAGQSAELAYSREDEMQADQLGLQYLSQAGYGANGLLAILRKIRGQQWFGSGQIPTYLSTHPAVEERIVYIDSWIGAQSGRPKKRLGENPENFGRAHTQLVIRYGDERAVLKQFETALRQHPEDPLAHYRYGLILAQMGKRQDAIGQIRTALAKRAFDPHILKDLGRIYFLDGQYPEALNLLQSAHNLIADDPECLFFLGRTQIELGQHKAATAIFLDLADKYPDYKEPFYFLSESYGQQGNLAQAHYYRGVYYDKKREYAAAATQLQRALRYAENPAEKQKIEALLQDIEKKLARSRKRE
ncbi:MAG: M48 family metalloprotease [Desulfobacterales bacterium]|nr:MAG: M48 family metalloprotease [Desulfobacterales bacterium]